MTQTRPEPIERRIFESQRLIGEHPPTLTNRNKQLIFDTACPPGSTHAGRIAYSRWSALELPEEVDIGQALGRLVSRAGYYDYRDLLPAGTASEWHVNFADRDLFAFYASSLFAQDEMQVAEHPVLGALRECLIAAGSCARTVEKGRPTPILVMGAERRCRIATDRNPDEGRPEGLYGRAFARADAESVRRATTRIEPPTLTNLIAMAAPPRGSGPYAVEAIEYVLTTAFTAFRSAAVESGLQSGRPTPIVVHTGFWGCGAFGGNRVLMAALQLVAAEMAGLERLVFHTADAGGSSVLAEASRVLAAEGENRPTPTRRLIANIVARGFEWGVGDGN